MKKKKSSGGGANWMDTYGDMVTLLLCFFVLLYSMSTISEDNWKAIVMSFNPDGILTPTITSGGDGPNADASNQGGEMTVPSEEITQEEIDIAIEELYQALIEYRAEMGMENTLSLEKDGGVVYVRFRDTAFFNPNSPTLREDAYPILERISEILSQAAPAINTVRIQGHTAQADPDAPNNVTADRTLSSDRSLNVLIYIQNNSTVDPARLANEGCGQWHPLETNDTPEGRAANRRVELIISGRNLLEELGEDAINQYTVGTGSTSSGSGTAPASGSGSSTDAGSSGSNG